MSCSCDFVRELKGSLRKTTQLVPADKQKQVKKKLVKPIEKELDASELNDESLDELYHQINRSSRPLAKLSQSEDANNQFKHLRNKVIEERRRYSIEGLKNKLDLEGLKNKSEEQKKSDEEDFQAELKWYFYYGNAKDLNLVKRLRDDPNLLEKFEHGSTYDDTLRLLKNTEEQIRQRVKKSFQLLGYGNPFDEYPSPLVPIGYNEEKKLVAVYPESSAPFLVLDPNPQYVKLEEQTKDPIYNKLSYVRPLEDFNYIEYKLFAFSAKEVVCYLVEEEKEFYSDFLTKYKDLSKNNPFLRYSLAKVTDNIDIIKPELIRCLAYIKSKSPTMISSWYETEKEELFPLWKSKALDFPSIEECLKNQPSN